LIALAVNTAIAETAWMADEFIICRLVALVGDHLDWFFVLGFLEQPGAAAWPYRTHATAFDLR
tara:strand:- start:9 stop:197 length:189 start_codon:yes stop_codon:yes gene_type:complete